MTSLPEGNTTVACHSCGKYVTTAATEPGLRIVIGMQMRGWHFECGLDADGWWALFYAPEDAGTGREDHLAASPSFLEAVQLAADRARGN